MRVQLVLTSRVDASEISPASVASNDTVSSYAYCIEKLTKFWASGLKGIQSRTKVSFEKRNSWPKIVG